MYSEYIVPESGIAETMSEKFIETEPGGTRTDELKCSKRGPHPCC